MYIFRGHPAGVTALTSLRDTLISGDEEGNICFWSLISFRCASKWNHISRSKIQSLKIIRLLIKSIPRDILVCQSRDNGVKLVVCDDIAATDPSSLIVKEFSTYEALFSEGDAIMVDETTAVLAYPSNIDSHIVAVRYMGQEAHVLLSGNALREDEGDRLSRSAVFGIKLVPSQTDERCYHMFCGYEDGSILIFAVDLKLTKTVPELNVTGLKIDLYKKLNLGLTDFVSAFDVRLTSDQFLMVCGSPQKELIFFASHIDLKQETVEKITLKRPGTSVVAIRQDLKIVAAASWDNAIRLYSMKSRTLLVALRSHLKQVQSINFMKTSDRANYLMCCASLDGTISVHDIYPCS